MIKFVEVQNLLRLIIVLIKQMTDVKNDRKVKKNSHGAVLENLSQFTCCLSVTTLCRFQCDVSEICALCGCRLVNVKHFILT